MAGQTITGGHRVVHNTFIEQGGVMAHETDILLPQKFFPLARVRVMAAAAL